MPSALLAVQASNSRPQLLTFIRPEDLLALSRSCRFFNRVLQSSAFKDLWEDSMKLVFLPYEAAYGVAIKRPEVLPFRLIDLVYNPDGPCDRCESPSGPSREICFAFMRRLCLRCQGNL